MKQFIFSVFVLFALVSLQGCKTKLPYGKNWELTQIRSDNVPAGTRITIRFDQANSRYSGTASCNNYNGTFTLDGSSIKLSQGAATKKMCPNMTWEDKYLPILSDIDAWKISGSKLQLLSEGNVVATYK